MGAATAVATVTRRAVEAVDKRLRLRIRLVSMSFLMLFVELALIRWTAANNVYLAYLTNFVLLASFLGIGIGFLSADRGRELFVWTPVALALLVAFVLAFPVSLSTLSGPHQLRGLFASAPIPRSLSLAGVFALTVTTMACIGQGVGRVFTSFEALEAYRLDIVGSLGGIGVFALFSFLELPPTAWGVVAAVLLVVLVGRRVQLVALAAVVGLLAIESGSAGERWSPYYKISSDYARRAVVAGTPTHDVLEISANNIPHQTAYPISTLRQIEPFYFFPYRHVPRQRLGRVLIVGAGNGNDVAVALAEGARHIDAVEIDPVIQALGRRYHPNRPYSDSRVAVHIDDGRAFIQRTRRRYGLILFALPDSLTLLAGQGNLRLENYLFTVQSMRTVRRHLSPGGTFSMYNYYESFLLSRYAFTLKDVFGRAPCVELGDTLAGRRQAVLTVGAGATRNCSTHWHGSAVREPTDDWPFPYLPARTIPSFYWHTLLLMLIASLALVRLAGGPLRRVAAYADLALMGAAFLLLETKNVVQFALLFGTTWLVNALVFAGVLIAIYLAVETARHVRLPRAEVLYLALAGALLVAWAVPQESLLALPPVARFAAATGIAFAPIFLANLVFAQRFGEASTVAVAFAANLLGAIAGGMLEYLALVTGYRFLLVVVGGLYALAFALRPRPGGDSARMPG